MKRAVAILVVSMVVLGLLASGISCDKTVNVTATPTPTPTLSPTSSPTPTPTLVPTPTPSPSPSPTPTPTTTFQQLQIVSVTSPISAGAYATLKAKTVPNASCGITVYYKSGPSTAQGLYTKQADSSGNVAWTWKVGTRTTPGSWQIVVTSTFAGKTVSQQTYFTVQ